MAAIKKRKFSKKVIRALEKRGVNLTVVKEEKPAEDPKLIKSKKILVPEIISVKEFAERAGLPVTEIISELIKNGVMANINENIDFETAAIISDDLGLEIDREEENRGEFESKRITISDSKNLQPRPPVITIMGHVDHGKTTLLDKIRQAHVAEGESGGITQHISAYQINIPDPAKKKKTRKITFVDTPGHSAFSAMRSHGASLADIVVLIVATNDGVMPQTIEVIEQAKSYNLPIIVAINKIDLPDANIQKIKQQLSEYGLIGEEWGGKTIICQISAKTGAGIDQLLEMIILQSELLELRADPEAAATGIVIESHIHKGAGALAVVLIENGTIHLGDPIAVGSVFGKVRILEDFKLQPILSAGPSMPVRIAGFRSVPGFGDRVVAFQSDKEAKESAEKFHQRDTLIKYAAAKSIAKDKEEKKILNLILKSDVAGSMEAIKKALLEFKNPAIKVSIIFAGVGPISESDAAMAVATKAIILGFRVTISLPAKKVIEKSKISVMTYDIIYELVDDVKKILEDLLPPIISEVEIGRGEIIAEFRNDKKAVVVGIKIISGEFKVGDKVKIFFGDNESWRGNVVSLRRGKEQVERISAGIEAGIGLPAGAKYEIGNKIIDFQIHEEKQSL